jgi:cytochrome P450
VTMMALAKHPHVLLRAQEEVDAALSEVPTPADLPRLPYCAAIVQESLRWRPVSCAESERTTFEES